MEDLTLSWTNPTLDPEEAEWDYVAEDWRLARPAAEGVWVSHPHVDGISLPELLAFEIYGADLVAHMLEHRAAWLRRRGYVPDPGHETFIAAVANIKPTRGDR